MYMKTRFFIFLKALRLAPLLVLLCACQNHSSTYDAVVAARNLPAGTVIQAADVKMYDVILDDPHTAFGNAGLTNDRARVIGHTTKVDIGEGSHISINDIEP